MNSSFSEQAVREGPLCPFYRCKSSRTKRCFSDEMTCIMSLIVSWCVSVLAGGAAGREAGPVWPGIVLPPWPQEGVTRGHRRPKHLRGGQWARGPVSPTAQAERLGPPPGPQHLPTCLPAGPPFLVYPFRPLVSFSMATLFYLLCPVTYSPGSGHHGWEWRGLERLGGPPAGGIPS